MTLSRPMSEFGNSYDFAFSMIAAQPTEHSGTTALGLLVPAAPFPQQGLTVVARNRSCSAMVSAAGFSPTVGKPVRVAFSWGAGALELYVNGDRAGSTGFWGALGPLPGLFQVMKSDPFGISEK